ncbi:MAG: tubulin-like doman-containing protein [Phycisphaerae bacterium]
MATTTKKKSASKRGTSSKAKSSAVDQRKKMAETISKAKTKATGTTKASGTKSKTKASSSTTKKSTPKKRASSAKTTASKPTTKKRTAGKAKTSASKTTATTSPARKRKTGKPAGKSNSQIVQAKSASTSLIPTLALEEYEPQIAEAQGVKDTSKGSTKFGWVGAGQCGGRLVQSFYKLGYTKCLAVNTASQDLRDLQIPDQQKLLMDIGRKGAGKDMARGREAAVQYRQDIIHAIERIFSENVDHLMVAFGSGGGTGSGSVVPLIETIRSCAKHIGLKKIDRRIGVMCTLPSAGEAASPKVGENAFDAISELTRMAYEGLISPLIIVDNDKISKLYPGLTVRSFWPTVNNTVAGLFDIFNRLSALPSPYTSFDPVDYQSIMESGNCAIMGLTKVAAFKQKYDLSQAMVNNLQKTVLASGFELSTARVVGSIVVGGKKIMANTPGLQDSINHAFDVLTDMTGNATLHRGIYEDDRESLRVYSMFGGLDAPMERLEELRRGY